MAIILSPFRTLRPLMQSCADTLAQRAAERHRNGERLEDDHANFQIRFETYEANAAGIVGELIQMGVRRCIINPMDTPRAVEEAAVFQWSLRMPVNPDDLSTSTMAHKAPCSTPPGAAKPISRGRRALPGSSQDARARRDPSEADMEVSLCLLSGDELLRLWVPARSPVKDLKTALINAGETKFDLDLFHMGQILSDTDMISEFNGFHSGGIISVVRKEKPPPPRLPSWDGNRHCTANRCFTPDSVVRVLEDGVEVQRLFKHVKIGDMVRTGPGKGLGFYRRVQRVWKHPSDPSEEPLAAYELAEGCRITAGHPALVNGIWRKPEIICKDIASFETTTYQLEIEGHIDTVLVGSSSSVVCALLGCYCGEDFGWNIFTRKTVRCDQQPCKKCAKACIPGLTFDHTEITQQKLEARYEPY